MNLYHVTKFSPYFSFTVYCFYTKISSFMLVLSTRIVLDLFYLLIFHSEKFSTDVCRLPYAVNVNLNLSIDYLYKLGYNRYFLQRKYSELTTSHGHSRPMTLQYWTNQNVFPFVITYNPALRSISSIIRKHFCILISFPVAITSLKLHPL